MLSVALFFLSNSGCTGKVMVGWEVVAQLRVVRSLAWALFNIRAKTLVLDWTGLDWVYFAQEAKLYQK